MVRFFIRSAARYKSNQNNHHNKEKVIRKYKETQSKAYICIRIENTAMLLQTVSSSSK